MDVAEAVSVEVGFVLGVGIVDSLCTKKLASKPRDLVKDNKTSFRLGLCLFSDIMRSDVLFSCFVRAFFVCSIQPKVVDNIDVKVPN